MALADKALRSHTKSGGQAPGNLTIYLGKPLKDRLVAYVDQLSAARAEEGLRATCSSVIQAAVTDFLDAAEPEL
jgi:hypothetical protein